MTNLEEKFNKTEVSAQNVLSVQKLGLNVVLLVLLSHPAKCYSELQEG